MAYKQLALALSLIVVSSPISAATAQPPPMTAAPAGTPETRYCMKIEAVTGTRLETIECWTRAEWAEQEVDVDKDWPKEGVRVMS